MYTVQKFITKKMDRRQFLIALGIITLAVTGVSGIFKTLKDPNLLGLSGRKSKRVETGFGKGAYGT